MDLSSACGYSSLLMIQRSDSPTDPPGLETPMTQHIDPLPSEQNPFGHANDRLGQSLRKSLNKKTD